MDLSSIQQRSHVLTELTVLLRTEGTLVFVQQVKMVIRTKRDVELELKNIVAMVMLNALKI